MRFDVRRERGSKRYRKLRHAFLLHDPLCARCRKRGIIRGARQLDHVVPLKDAPERFYDTSNWQGLCDACHEEKTANENRLPDANDGRWLSRAQTAAWQRRIQGMEGTS